MLRKLLFKLPLGTQISGEFPDCKIFGDNIIHYFIAILTKDGVCTDPDTTPNRQTIRPSHIFIKIPLCRIPPQHMLSVKAKA
jgi:hypothetical protein